MVNARQMERLFYVCLEANCNDSDSFPMLDERDYMGMYSDYSSHSSDICMYIFFRDRYKNTPFVDIYVWDAANLDGYSRFVICEGLRLPEESEAKYLEYVHNEGIIISTSEFHYVNKRIIEEFPQWHYKDYRTKYLSMALQHLYFVSHPSGPREILFKAEGLEYIAANIEKLPSYNVLGTTPSSIIDQDIPLKLLRILAHEAHFDLLCDMSNREICKAAYQNYRGVIGKGIPSVGQWNYILELYKNGGFFGGYGFKKEIYDKATNFVYPNEIDAYEKYFSIRKELNIPGKLIVPDFEEIWSALEQMEDIIRYKNGKTHKDILIKARKAQSYRYEYSNSEFEIIMPSCVFDIYREAISQHNCAADYISDHADGETTILFLRKKEKPNIPFVTMEIGFDDDIVQVYGACNTLPDRHVYEFIVEYAQARNLSYDMEELIISNISKIDRNDAARKKDLVEFAIHTRCSMRNNMTDQSDFQHGNSTEFHQISLEECFPYLFEIPYTDLGFDDEFGVF